MQEILPKKKTDEDFEQPAHDFAFICKQPAAFVPATTHESRALGQN